MTWRGKYIFKYGSSLVWCSMLSKYKHFIWGGWTLLGLMILPFIFILQKCTFCYWRKKNLHFLQLIFHVVWAASSAVMQYGNWHLRSIHNCSKRVCILYKLLTLLSKTCIVFCFFCTLEIKDQNIGRLGWKTLFINKILYFEFSLNSWLTVPQYI